MGTRKRFGQHFLEPVWADKVVNAIAPTGDDTFLEIGPGPGILTLRLAPNDFRCWQIRLAESETHIRRFRAISDLTNWTALNVAQEWWG